jgi:transmembrane sensor
VFDSTPLPEVAEEFNRYNTRRLSVAPAHLEDFRVSGIFSSTDPGSLVRFLREQPGVRVEESEREIRVSSD